MSGLLPLIPYDVALERVGDPERSRAIVWLPPSHPFLRHCQTHPLVVDARLAYAEYDNPELVDCETCGASGFSQPGTGYGDVCPECGGQKQLPRRRQMK